MGFIDEWCKYCVLNKIPFDTFCKGIEIHESGRNVSILIFNQTKRMGFDLNTHPLEIEFSDKWRDIK